MNSGAAAANRRPPYFAFGRKKKMKVEFLSVGSCMPEMEQADTVSLLLNGHIMVDTGWHAVRNLLRAGIDPKEIRTIFFTHMHQDHYLGLAQFLFYLMNGYHDFGTLCIYGPEDIEEIASLALRYAGYERHYADIPLPKIRQLPSTGKMDFDEIQVRWIPSHHAAPGRCYQFQGLNEKESVTYSGDTARFKEMVDFVHGSKILIHESSFGAHSAPTPNPYGHSSAMDAAKTALKAGVEKLYLVHCGKEGRRAAIEAAQEIFPNTSYPKENETFLLL